MEKHSQHYPGAQTSKLFQAACSGKLSHSTREAAERRLEQFRKRYTVSSRFVPDDEQSIVVWCYDYQVSSEEAAQGFLGNYALVRIVCENGLFTVIAQKYEVDCRYHPRRLRPRAAHPDWGHPLFRSVKSARPYVSRDKAEQALRRLAIDYPAAVIPAGPKTYATVYQKADDPPYGRYILELDVAIDGSCRIVCRANPNLRPMQRGKVDPTHDSILSYLTTQKARAS